jgi:hypothetical protein
MVVGMATTGCQPEGELLFTKLPSSLSGVDFQNTIQENSDINILTYEYTYNGGGVAAADFNNDGYCDLYFSGNMVSNRLYLNKSNLAFDDITESAGVSGRELWKTGVTAADVNADGWLDIYVCYSGPDLKQSLSNQLFINNGGAEPSFTERAKEYGLDAPDTYSTQASFFDYDKDGDLDMFLVNHGNHFYSPFVNTNKLRNMRHSQFGNRLYRNDLIAKEASNAQPHFTEVSQEAGIHGGGINFGLGVSISDVNNDSWPDIFVTNDYEEQDFLYLNNQNGTFKEVTKQAFGHLSRNGMGTDMADYNNDGKPDLMEVDMWPEDNLRQKLLKGPDDYNRYQLMIDSGFHHQQMRNTLQLNSGVNEAGTPLFCEVGQLAGVSATDWSWAPLFADVDNDGFKDLFITNGYLRDFTSLDFLKFTVQEARTKAQQEGKELDVYELVSKMPSTKTKDYIFKNNGDLTFTDQTKQWGLDVPNLSFGSAYADLDNDGDLELITNNTNEPAAIWKNNSDQKKSNYLRIKLVGPKGNVFGIGAKVTVVAGSLNQMLEQYASRGYQSSVDPILHVGLGSYKRVNTIIADWPDGRQSILRDVKSNQQIELNYTTAGVQGSNEMIAHSVLFQDVSKESGVQFVHQENKFVDFDREPLMPYQLSRTGPALAKGDVNGDGAEDFYIGGAMGQSGQLYIRDKIKHFIPVKSQPWRVDQASEDTGATFFDVDGDGDQDLFVVSGGNEYPSGSENLDDRLYLNDGMGNFEKVLKGMVKDHANGSCVAAADYDKDGDLDLFIGGRSLPGSFPLTTPGAVLKNEFNKNTGEIKFSVATQEVNPSLREPGMVTDALWTDFNNDSWPDLLVVGEWMPVRLFENKQGKLVEVKHNTLQSSAGLWSRIVAADMDRDGDQDYVLGNAGTNLSWHASIEEPMILTFGDFNADGKIDPVICTTVDSKNFPVASRDEILLQLPTLKKKFTSYSVYGNATLEDILDPNQLTNAKQLQITTLQTSMLENRGNSEFELKPLPIQAQISSVNGILIDDFNGDGFTDILISGNYYPYRTQYGPCDAGVGLLLAGNNKKEFKPISWELSGFLADGDIRNMIMLKGKSNMNYIVAARNNNSVLLFELKSMNQTSVTQ